MGTSRGINNTCNLRFKGKQGHSRHPNSQSVMLENPPHLQAIWFQGSNQLNRKDNAIWAPQLLCKMYLCYHRLFTHRLANVSTIACHFNNQMHTQKQLGSASPCPKAVHMEPFSTSIFKDSIWIIATTTKICTKGCFTKLYSKSCTTSLQAHLHTNVTHHIVD